MPSAVSALLAARVDPNQTSNASSTPALMEAAIKVYFTPSTHELLFKM